MISKASGRSASILAAGLFVLLASAADAATDDSTANPRAASAVATSAKFHRVRHVSHHRRSYAHLKAPAPEVLADADEKTMPPHGPANAPADDTKALPAMSPSVANANAQMLLAGIQTSAATAIPSGGNAPPAASGTTTDESGNERIVVAADQLNDVDRSLQESSPQPAIAPPPALMPAATMTNDNTVWDQTSLIGKIFIAFGALLTMASAARMFMA